jgi:hypothetical protein
MRFVIHPEALPATVSASSYVELTPFKSHTDTTDAEAGEQVDAQGDLPGACHWGDILVGILFVSLIVTGIVLIVFLF